MIGKEKTYYYKCKEGFVVHSLLLLLIILFYYYYWTKKGLYEPQIYEQPDGIDLFPLSAVVEKF